MALKLLDDDEGAQIIEYAMIVAAISLGLLLALQALPVSAVQAMKSLATRTASCLSGGDCS